MKANLKACVSMLLLIATVAFAEEEEIENPGVTIGEAPEITRGLFEKNWTITPRVGSLGFQDNMSLYSNRIVEGFTTNLSLGNLFGRVLGFDIGLESGLLFSHVGSPGANFLGTGAPVKTAEGTNTYLVPLNATLGYSLTDRLMVSTNFGATLFNRSIGYTMILGSAGDLNSGSATEFFPNIGLNVGWAATPNLGLSLRGDLIPTPSTRMYTATLGLILALT